MKCIKIDALNHDISNNLDTFISDAEKNYYAQLEIVCRAVNDNKDTHPVLLISGPSGSGKTTTANEISRMLRENFDCKSSVISLDNYFRSNKSPDMPRDKNGKIDLESPYCTDLPLLQEHLRLIDSGEEFMMPVFDFKIQDRSGYVPFKREKGSIAILEGIHSLNPLVTGDCGDFALCLYVSVRTRLKSSADKLLHPRLIRLMRRLCRDSLFRGRDLPSIFSFFESVSEGEDKYILPFKYRADFQIDTFMSYEVPVYKNFLWDKLIQSADVLNGNSNYSDVKEFFECIQPMGREYVPENSFIHEFIG